MNTPDCIGLASARATTLWRGIARGRLALKYSLNTSTAAAEEATRLWGVVCHTKKAPEMRKWVAILPLVLPLNMQSRSEYFPECDINDPASQILAEQ